MILLILLTITNTAFASDIGKTYAIVEPNALEEIQARAGQIDMRGYGKKLRETVVDTARLPKSQKDEIGFYKPFFTLEEAVVDKELRVIYPAGFRFNPLEFTKHESVILAVDIMDIDRVDTSQADIVLVDGALTIADGYSPLTKIWAERLGLKTTPARVRQVDEKWEITTWSLQ